MAKAQVSNELEDFHAGNEAGPTCMIPLDKILVDKSKNLRRFPAKAADIKAMALSISKIGLLHPLIVCPLSQDQRAAEGNEGKEWELRAGFQRWDALLLGNEGGILDMEAVECRILDPASIDMDDVNSDENDKRIPVSHIDQAYTVHRYQEAGFKNQEIAAKMGKANAWVTYVSKLYGLRPEVQKMIHEGKINFRLARELPEMTEEEQDQRIVQVIAGESGTEVAAESKKGKKKDKRGRKAKEDQTATAQGISAKKAVSVFEEAVAELKALEKPNKAQDKALTLYADLGKFMAGRLGAQALDNRIMALL